MVPTVLFLVELKSLFICPPPPLSLFPSFDAGAAGVTGVTGGGDGGATVVRVHVGAPGKTAHLFMVCVFLVWGHMIPFPGWDEKQTVAGLCRNSGRYQELWDLKELMRDIVVDGGGLARPGSSIYVSLIRVCTTEEYRNRRGVHSMQPTNRASGRAKAGRTNERTNERPARVDLCCGFTSFHLFLSCFVCFCLMYTQKICHRACVRAFFCLFYLVHFGYDV